MKGHIRERSPGHWAIVIDVRDAETGRRKRCWHSFAGTKRQAQIEAARLISELQGGASVDPSKETLAAFFERWLTHMQGQVSPRSLERYTELARKNIAPLLGGLTLSKLQPAHISAAYAKALTSGRRDGQGGLSARTVAALRWRHIDFNAGHVSVEQSAEQTRMGVRYKQPKSGRARTVAMGAMIAAELRAHRIAQAQALLGLGVRLDDDSFVVAQPDGSPLQPRTLTHNWVLESAKTGLPRIRFHDLRHTHATHLLASGVHPKIASERLGHSKVGVTLDTYSHVLPNMQADAAALVDTALQNAMLNRTKT